MSSKPTIVLVHGAWHSPSHMDALKNYLQSHGYAVQAPFLPSMHADDVTKITLTDDIAAVRDSILEALTSNNVVVLAHSYAAVPTSGALEGLDFASRKARDQATSVTGYLIISGLLVSAGNSVQDQFGNTPAPPHDVRGPLLYIRDPPGPCWLFYHDVSFDVAVESAKILKPQAWAVNKGALPHAGHLIVPTRYMICEKDNALPAMFQRMMVDMARKELNEGASIEGDVIDSSHSPFLSRMEVVGGWVRKYGGVEEIGEVEGLGRY